MELPMEGDEDDVRRMLVWLYTGEVCTPPHTVGVITAFKHSYQPSSCCFSQ